MEEQHLLTADIGGTNCRFAHFTLSGEVLTLHSVLWEKTADIPDTDTLLEACAASMGLHPREADALIIAMAGPITGGLRGTLTNAPLEVDLTDARTRHGIRRCRIINDFTAEAYACLTDIAARARMVVTPTSPPPEGVEAHTRGVLGAGTGLGTASLVRDTAGSWLAVPAEGGHTVFPFIGEEEIAFQAFICRELGYPYARGDDVLTGRGLTLLHRFLTGRNLSPSEVGEQALGRDCPTLRWYARFYARTCRNWILTTLCRGGLYIAGGIAARNPFIATCPWFSEEFHTTPRFEALIRSVPVFLIEDKNSGLWGAARAGTLLLREGVEP